MVSPLESGGNLRVAGSTIRVPPVEEYEAWIESRHFNFKSSKNCPSARQVRRFVLLVKEGNTRSQVEKLIGVSRNVYDALPEYLK